MRITRIVLAAALAALAALAFTATAANAEHEESVTNHEEPMEVTDEVNHCPAVTNLPADEIGDNGDTATGGCAVTAHGELILAGHLFGFESTISDCENEFDAIVGEEGEGWVQDAHLEDHTGLDDCTFIPCPETGSPMEAWPIHIREDTGTTGTQEWLATEFCVTDDDGSNERRCEIEFPVHADPLDPHHYEITTPAGGSEGQNHENAPNCEFEGQIEIEPGQIEIEHDHPAP